MAWLAQEQRHYTRRAVVAAGIGTLGLSGCAPGADLPTLPELPAGPYRLGAGDQIRVTTVGGEQLTGTFGINDTGDVALPLVGEVHAAGLTTQHLASAIAAELQRKKLFRDPSVVVEVQAYRPIFILGEVNKPGQYPFIPGMTVLTAVSVAGGFTYRAVTGYAAVVRTEGRHASEGRVGRGTVIQPGDVITIFERRF